MGIQSEASKFLHPALPGASLCLSQSCPLQAFIGQGSDNVRNFFGEQPQTSRSAEPQAAEEVTTLDKLWGTITAFTIIAYWNLMHYLLLLTLCHSGDLSIVHLVETLRDWLIFTVFDDLFTIYSYQNQPISTTYIRHNMRQCYWHFGHFY